MFKQIFLNFTDHNLIILGFILFMGTFIGALIWTLFVQKNSFYEELSLKPLNTNTRKKPLQQNLQQKINERAYGKKS